MQLLVDFSGGEEPVIAQLGQLVLQVGAADRQEKSLALLKNLVQLGLMLCEARLQTLVGHLIS